jgi:hypothetical protein
MPAQIKRRTSEPAVIGLFMSHHPAWLGSSGRAASRRLIGTPAVPEETIRVSEPLENK